MYGTADILRGGAEDHALRDAVRIDGYPENERLTALTGDHPKYLGWVPAQKKQLWGKRKWR